ncbi:CBS domain containing membrane protein [Leptothrix cholodnii SP-6]|uniref:CBS domain containing membrane protein n=1 Tax=Leptothrix cholodnii (strain ATCC 51168 / LMG 8142 / SP-6) TaxID=395495 RepID=B1Y3N7_LEPCP|nr:CBS domain-containing protein [Leptothrix cholodnii]ACB35740.1 CBS domain containing membrane protein [Leptothrix cholodnii SP-6]
MFYVHGIGGRMYAATLEQLRQVAPTTAVARPRRIATLGREPDDAPDRPQSPLSTPADTGHRAALAAYADAGQALQPRQSLRCVADVMSRRVLSVAADASVLQAWQQLAREGIGQAPVLDTDARLVGLLLRAELMRGDSLERAATDPPAWRAWLAQPVRAVMWTPVPAASPDTDLRRLAAALLGTGLPGLPVSDAQGGLIGFVSRSDILRAVTADPPLDLWG